jgi:2,4-dienoyl-CoA reductase-like NADH-dependent reductase (Old Yellow Enzyme family)
MDPATRFGHDGRVQDPLARPLKLACGATLPNRVAKAAMTEGLADPHDQPTERHTRLYQRWAEGGVGLSITGNVMVDRRFLERSGNVVLDQTSSLDAFPCVGQGWHREGRAALHAAQPPGAAVHAVHIAGAAGALGGGPPPAGPVRAARARCAGTRSRR